MAKAKPEDLVLNAQLIEEINKMRDEKAFDAKAWIESKCARLNAYMSKCGLKTCIVSVSGGVDSAVVLNLCMYASKMPGSPISSVAGLCQPIHSSDWALARGKEVIAGCGATMHVLDQTPVFDMLLPMIETACQKKGTVFANGQLKSYMRTPANYMMAQLYSAHGAPAIVMGTGNKSEDGYLYFFAKCGDGCVDVSMIEDLYKSEVFIVGAALGVPKSVLDAPPSADLMPGTENNTDEAELGVSYDFVELLMAKKVEASAESFAAWHAALTDESKAMFNKFAAIAEATHARNSHKAGIVNL